MLVSSTHSIAEVKEGIIYRILNFSDVSAASECFTTSFQREPMVKAIGICKDDFLPFAELCCFEAAKTEMGIVAENLSSGKIIGVSILQDCLADDLEFDLNNFNILRPIFGILGMLQEEYIIDKKIQTKGEIAVSFVTGIDKDFEGQGISLELFAQSMNLAVQKGFQSMITQVTGRLSQNAARRRFNFSEYSKILYHNYEFNGKKVFEKIEDKLLSCVLMERAL